MKSLQVLSILQLVGIVLCLSAASKISHRAQALGSVASRWHALVTCDLNDASQSGISIDGKNLDAANSASTLGINNSESELETGDFVPFAIHNQFATSFLVGSLTECSSTQSSSSSSR